MAQTMTPRAQSAMNKVFDIIMKQNGGLDATKVFNVDPKRAQSIEDHVQQKNSFLQAINYTGVNDIAGEVLHFGGDGTITKRTSTMQPDGSFRRHNNPAELIARDYHCKEIEQDTLIKWALIDAWAHLPNFYKKLRNHIMGLQARDNLRVMWHGQFAAADSDATEYPFLQDIQRGFIQYLIEKNPENMLGISPDANETLGYKVDTIRVGAGAGANGFESMDQLAVYLKDQMIDKLYRKNSHLRIIAGDSLTFSAKDKLISLGDDSAEEKIAVRKLLGNLQIGELQRMESDEFPDFGLFICDPKNLSHYWQRDSVRSEYNQTSHAKKGVVSHYYKNCDNVIEAVEGVAGVHPDAIEIPAAYGADGKATSWKKATDAWKVD